MQSCTIHSLKRLRHSRQSPVDIPNSRAILCVDKDDKGRIPLHRYVLVLCRVMHGTVPTVIKYIHNNRRLIYG